jgi:transketolase
MGFIDQEELQTLRKMSSRLQGHPNHHKLPYIDFSTGSLGQSLSVAIGIGLGLSLNKGSGKVYCLLGDGEMQEGQVWEAAMAAPGLKLSNLIAIIDRNQLQNDGLTEKIIPLGDLKQKWESFGWRVHVVDGHDFRELHTSISEGIQENEKPTVIIANTVKGKGISFMENVVHWHHHPINNEDYNIAMKELERMTFHGM